MLTVDVLKEIDRYRGTNNTLTHEGIGNFLSAVGNLITKGYRNILLKVDEMVDLIRFIKIDQFMKDLRKERFKIKDIQNKLEFYKIEDLKVPTVPGLRTDLLGAIGVVGGLTQICNTQTLANIDRLDTTVSNFISDPEFGTSSRPYVPDPDVQNYVEELREKMATLIDTNNPVEETTANKLIANLSSLSIIYNQLEDIAKTFRANYLEDVNKKYKILKSKTEKLVSVLSNKSEVSKASIQQLSDEFYTAAELLTLTISVHYLYSQLLMVTTNLIIRLHSQIQ